MGIANELRTADAGFAIVESYPELKNVPIVIGECDPDGCAACQGEQLGYRNSTLYSSYTAASFCRLPELADRRGVNLDAALTWAFEFEGQPPFAGFRQLASAGLDLPVLNVFRMFSQMSGQRLAVNSDGAVSLDDIQRHGVREKPDVSGFASLDNNKIAVMLWHYHDDDVPGPIAKVSLKLEDIPAKSGKVTVARYAIDADHSNAFTAWKKMGSPRVISDRQRAALEKAGKLARIGSPKTVRVHDGRLTLDTSLPRQAVMLLVIDWSPSSK